MFASSAAFAQAAKVADTPKGKAYVDAKGMTLYTFDKDAGGKSACNGPCATNWPPLMAAADAKASGDWTIVTRDDGSKMWALKGKPLYTFAKDTKPGDTTGDGFLNGAWHIAEAVRFQNVISLNNHSPPSFGTPEDGFLVGSLGPSLRLNIAATKENRRSGQPLPHGRFLV